MVKPKTRYAPYIVSGAFAIEYCVPISHKIGENFPFMLPIKTYSHWTAQIGLGPAGDWTVHAAELIAIQQAVELIEEAVWATNPT